MHELSRRRFLGLAAAAAAMFPALGAMGAPDAKGRKTMILNIDFHDLVVANPIPGSQYIGHPDGYYPADSLRQLIQRAADSGFRTIYFRIAVCGRAACRSKVKEAPDHRPEWPPTLERYDPFEVAVKASHDAGVQCYAWITPFDDAGPKLGTKKPGMSQSKFSFEHPEFQLQDRDGDDPLYGVYCFGHPEVRTYFLDHIRELLAYGPDGIFLSNRTHSNMSLRQKERGFNPPVIQRYTERFGHDPRNPAAYDLRKFSQIQGEFYTQFLREAAEVIHGAGKRCAAGVSWQRNGRIAPRLGALDKCFFEWQTWANDGIVDELVIGGDAATGLDPEHILPNYELKADSANPDFFRGEFTPACTAQIQRWITLWPWYWKGKEEIATGGYNSFTAKTVRTMLDKLAGTTLDGIVLHEALNLAQHNQWDMVRDFVQSQPAQP
jgi:hypothetical protein